MPRNAAGFETITPDYVMGPHVVSPLPSPFAEGGDPSIGLPLEPARRFRLLRDAVADADAIQHGLAARLVDLTEAGQRARRRLAEINGQYGVDADHPEHIAMTAAATNSAEELDRLNVRIAAHDAIAGPRRALLGKVTNWLRSNAAGHDFAEVELVEVPKLLKGETPATAVDRLRRRLRELSADETRINSAPFPSAFAKQMAAAYLDRLATAPVVTNLIEHGGGLVVDGQPVEPPIVFPTKMIRAEVDTATGRGIAIGEVPDIIGIVAFVCQDLLLAKVGELIDLEAEDKIALTHEQRREQLAVIRSDREAIELEESFWIWQAFASGTIIEPRADVAPSAFLMVQAIRADRRPGVDLADGIARARLAREAAGPTAS